VKLPVSPLGLFFSVASFSILCLPFLCVFFVFAPQVFSFCASTCVVCFQACNGNSVHRLVFTLAYIHGKELMNSVMKL
jgi:uncharacterized membrane protein YcfT